MLEAKGNLITNFKGRRSDEENLRLCANVVLCFQMVFFTKHLKRVAFHYVDRSLHPAFDLGKKST